MWRLVVLVSMILVTLSLLVLIVIPGEASGKPLTAIQFNGSQFLVLPQCNVTSNPYGGANGTYGLLNCIAIEHGALSVVMWIYLTNGTRGGLLGIQSFQYPSTSGAWTPLLYIGTDGNLWLGEANIIIPGVPGSGIHVFTNITPGWHLLVFEEWANSTSGPFYQALYIDGRLALSASSSGLVSLFGLYGPYPYNDIGTAYTAESWASSGGNGGWFFFNGSIAYIAIYRVILNLTQVRSMYSEPGYFPEVGLVALYNASEFNYPVWYSIFGGLGLGVYGRLAVVTRTLGISVLSVTTTSIITQIISPILLAVVVVVVAVVVVLIIRRHG